MKSLIKGKEIYRDPGPSAMEDDEELSVLEDDKEEGWDDFLDEAPDNYEPDMSID
jgi:hypothetical protein